MQFSSDTIYPSWTTIRFVSQSVNQITIVIDLLDEIGEQAIDISPGTATSTTFTLNLNTRVLGGDLASICTWNKTCNVSGNAPSNAADISFIVSDFLLRDMFNLTVPTPSQTDLSTTTTPTPTPQTQSSCKILLQIPALCIILFFFF